MARRRTAAALLALALTIAGGGPAYAQGPGYRSSWEVDVSVDVRRDVTDLSYEDGRRVETRYTHVNASLWETSIPWFQPGLTVGTGWLSTDGDTALEGREPAGENLGLMLRSELPLADPLYLRGEAAWTYHDLDDGDVSLDWHDASARAGLGGRFGRVVLEGGGVVRAVDGNRRIDGEETVRLEERESTGLYATAAVYLDPTGYVRLGLESGTRDAVTVRFARRF